MDIDIQAPITAFGRVWIWYFSSIWISAFLTFLFLLLSRWGCPNGFLCITWSWFLASYDIKIVMQILLKLFWRSMWWKFWRARDECCPLNGCILQKHMSMCYIAPDLHTEVFNWWKTLLCKVSPTRYVFAISLCVYQHLLLIGLFISQ